VQLVAKQMATSILHIQGAVFTIVQTGADVSFRAVWTVYTCTAAGIVCCAVCDGTADCYSKGMQAEEVAAGSVLVGSSELVVMCCCT
jgi:fructose-1,6-bisphosphatase/inositol monophosphatase family enzyme